MSVGTLSVRTGDGTSGAPVETVLNPRGSCLIGRSISADMLIDDARVSRRHLLIEPEEHGWRIRDVSSNGSWHNGARVDAGGLLVDRTGTVRIFLGDPLGPEVAITYQAPRAADPVA
ncbi:MAG TPA: FHA domain-containing protein, partial [Actinopolymorphaceae bacterium]|nr:FHA domain-containing protein [Actinopolymorphaceae bacterium]